MDSIRDFEERFRRTETEELLVRLATAELTETATLAIHNVLRERGIDQRELDGLVKEAHKARLRQAAAPGRCAHCHKKVWVSAIEDGDQEFCSRSCLSAARLEEAAIDIDDAEAQRLAAEIRTGNCPSCSAIGSPIEIRRYHWVWSAVLISRWGTSSKLSCRRCGVQTNLWAIVSCLVLGWWGFPFGILLTPIQIAHNMGEIRRRSERDVPSGELVELARMQLAARLLAERTLPGEERVPA